MSTRRFCSLLLLSILLFTASSGAHSWSAGSPQAQRSTVPRLKLNITDWWNAPVEISSVRIDNQEVLPGASIEATDDWAKHVSIEGINKTDKTISYISYAIDFTVAGEDKLYRIRLQDGNFYMQPDALTAPDGLRVPKKRKHNVKFSDNAWTCHSTLVSNINERKARITNVELFVEAVGFTDDTLWSFGSRLKRNKDTNLFENVEFSGNKNHASARSSQPPDCCVVVLNYTSGGAKPTRVQMSCSSCPPSSGGGSCPPPVPIVEVNSLSGQGTSGIMQTGFTHC